MSKKLSPVEQELADAIAAAKLKPATTTKTTKKAEKPKVEKPRKLTRAVKATLPPVEAPTVEEPAPPAEAPTVEEPAPPAEEPTVEETVDPSEAPVVEDLAQVFETEAPQVFETATPVAPQVAMRMPASAMSIYSNRYHQRFLNNMYGAMLTLLDAQGRILLFVAGALRCRTSDTTDTVLSVSTTALLGGIRGIAVVDGKPVIGAPYEPAVTATHLTGDARRGGWKLDNLSEDWSSLTPIELEKAAAGGRRGVLREVPALTKILFDRIPEARRWGIMTVGVSPTKRMINGIPNGENSEVYLNDMSWKDGDPIPGSSTSSLLERLAPEALQHANSMPNAWLLAVTGASLFGGMKEFPPLGSVKTVASPTLNAVIKSETSTRAFRQRDMENNRRRGDDPADSFGNLASAMEAVSPSPWDK
jgi:hypothetical protein